MLLLVGALLVAGPIVAQSVDSTATRRPAAPAASAPPLPRLGLRMSAGHDFAGTKIYYLTSPKYWLALEANRWLGRHLSLGLATIALVPIGPYREYSYTGCFQGHLTYTFIHERPFSLNVRVGVFGVLRRTIREVGCDFGCNNFPPQTYLDPGWMMGLYPTFRLTDRWSLDGTLEVRALQQFTGLIGLGVKLRIPALSVPTKK